MKVYDYLVVGKGLFGSAAVRYLSAVSENVALVGPDEPADWLSHDGVFASHYDESRVVSQTAADDIWTQLDQASIAAYSEIEAGSGVTFFTPSGRLTAVPHGHDTKYPYLSNDAPNSQTVEAADLASHIPYTFPANYDIVLEGAPSGYLNPRRMVQAQMTLAQKQGTAVIRQVVQQIQKGERGAEVRLANGEVLLAGKVLLATGAFSNCFDLLERKLALKAESVTAVLAEVSLETAERLKGAPPLNYKSMAGQLTHLTLLPPLLYPNGRYYLKLYTLSDADKILPDFDALSSWFRADDLFVYLSEAKKLLQELLSDVEFLSWQMQPCAACYTPWGKPMIDVLEYNQIYVAVGGNGGGAHPSDAIGKLAADLMLQNDWGSELPREPFRLQFADEWGEWMHQLSFVWDK